MRDGIVRYGVLMASLAAIAGFAAPASAQRSRAYVDESGYGAPYERSARAPRAYCERLCERDMSPCDPIQFKVTDGRCAGINPGRY